MAFERAGCMERRWCCFDYYYVAIRESTIPESFSKIDHDISVSVTEDVTLFSPSSLIPLGARILFRRSFPLSKIALNPSF